MQDHIQSVQQLSQNLAKVIDMFEGIGEACRKHSTGIHYMLEVSMQGGEILGEREYITRYAALADMLECAGFYMLGTGHFSVVLGHDDQPSTAFKLSLKPEDSYVAYAMYCRQNPGQHLPEIRCMIRAREAQVIALKRYVPYYAGAEIEGFSNAEFPSKSYSFLQYWRDAEQVRIEMRNEDEYHNPIYTDEYIDTLVRIGKHFEGAATFDIHSDNLMYDTDTGCFIITDPVSFKKERTDATQPQRPNSDRTDHHAAAQAGTTPDPAARSVGAGIKQVRPDVQARHPRTNEGVNAVRHNRMSIPRVCVGPRFTAFPQIRITGNEYAKAA